MTIQLPPKSAKGFGIDNVAPIGHKHIANPNCMVNVGERYILTIEGYVPAGAP